MSVYTKMHPKYKKIWLEALRSRKYKQTTSMLQNNAGFCCLGVLCHSTHTKFEPGSGSLNDDHRNKFGLDYESIDRLVNMNDSTTAKFGRIANWIEKNL